MNKNLKSKTKWAASVGGFFSTSAVLSQAATMVQIDFTNNQITGGGGNQLFSDMDFDGDSDFTRSSSAYRNAFSTGFGRVNIEGNLNRGYINTFLLIQTANTVNGVTSTNNGWVSVNLTGSVLGDHQGFLEIVTNSSSQVSAGVYITRFLYDADSATTSIADRDSIGLNGEATSVGVTSATSTTVTPIPEPSSLALLAAGAGGLLLRRRRKVAA